MVEEKTVAESPSNTATQGGLQEDEWRWTYPGPTLTLRPPAVVRDADAAGVDGSRGAA